MHKSFLAHKGGLYFWLAVLLTLSCIGWYANDDPKQPPNGGTALGYTLGWLGALMILWLTYLGRRKRNFVGGWGSVRGWVSAHVYFGAALLIVATLHTGFQFGWNVHTVAFILMVLVIASGFYGVYTYNVNPRARNDLKSGKSLDEIFLQLEEVDTHLKRLAAAVGADFRSVTASAIERTVIGGSFFDQIFGRDRSLVMIENQVMTNPGQQPALEYLVDGMAHVQGEEARVLDEMVKQFGTRKRLLSIIREDIRLHASLQVWLLIHVPLTFALIASLVVHVFAVTVYW